MTAKDIKKLLFSVYKRYRDGSISESQATRESSILNSILKAIEVVDLEDRIIKLENIHIKKN